MIDPLPPVWLIRLAVAAVWLYEGLWCKLLRGDPRQEDIVLQVPRLGPRHGILFLNVLGAAEVGIGLWVLSGAAALPCAWVQTLLLITLNTNGIFWARRLLHDPVGMVVKNVAFLLLAWVAASPAGP